MPDNTRETLTLEAKALLHRPRSGALASLRSGAPFNSLVTFATDYDGSPIFLLSTLAIHTQNLITDPRCALLLQRNGKGDPLAHPRLTVTGTAKPDQRPHIRARFLARQPKAALYADFADFSFYRMDVSDFHLNGGFARAADFAADEILAKLSNLEDFASAEADIVARLNKNHLEILRHAVATATQSAPKNYRATGIDPEGIDLVCGEDTFRISLPLSVIDNIDIAAQLKALSSEHLS
eukprot:gene15487-15631_t